MAITETPLTGSSSTTNATSYTTASITPTGNRLVLLAVCASLSGQQSNVPAVSGNGLTWVQVATDVLGSGFARLTLFRAMGASPSAGVVTIDYTAQTQLRCIWSIAEFEGIDTSGTNGSGAIVQSNTKVLEMVNPSLTLSAFGSASNATYGAVTADSNAGDMTPGSGFNEIHDVNGIGEGLSLETEWKDSSDTSIDWTGGGGSIGYLMIAAEIKAATAGGGSSLSGRRALLGVGG